MLPAAHRMLRSEDFTVAVRCGARAGNRRLVIHYCAGESGDTNPALVGVVVPKKQVLRANRRNRIKRQVRHLMRERVSGLEPGSRVVIRGLAGADGASSAQLGADLDRLLARCREQGGRRRRSRPPVTAPVPAASEAASAGPVSVEAPGRHVGPRQ